MSKPIKKLEADSEFADSASCRTDNLEAFEMIEVAINDIDLLARAFEVISEACGHQKVRSLSDQADEEQIPEFWLH